MKKYDSEVSVTPTACTLLRVESGRFSREADQDSDQAQLWSCKLRVSVPLCAPLCAFAIVFFENTSSTSSILNLKQLYA